MVLVLCEMQSASSRVWTRVAVSIFYDDTLFYYNDCFQLQMNMKTKNKIYDLQRNISDGNIRSKCYKQSNTKLLDFR